MNWKPWAKNKPKENFVFEIRKSDVLPLTEFLAGRAVVIGDEKWHNAKFGHRLHLVALDMAKPEALKDKAFLNHFA